jgi:hypothetical protein
LQHATTQRPARQFELQQLAPLEQLAPTGWQALLQAPSSFCCRGP